MAAITFGDFRCDRCPGLNTSVSDTAQTSRCRNRGAGSCANHGEWHAYAGPFPHALLSWVSPEHLQRLFFSLQWRHRSEEFMPIRFACSCGKEWKVADSKGGKNYRCTICRALIAIPTAPA